MTFLPIADRELRVASRRRRTYWGRMSMAVVALFFAGWMLLAMRYMPPQQIGQNLFGTLATLTMINAAIVGFRATCDSLSEEKREGTLGLLFLTDLKGYDVVIGKLFANSLGTFYGILAVLPVLAISLLLGGVTYAQFARVALTAINILFLSLSIGMFSSAVCRDERRAMSLSVLLMIILAVYAPLAGWAWSESTGGRYNEIFNLPSPITSVVQSFAGFGSSSSRGQEYWISTALTHGYAWILLLLACFIVPHSWKDKARSSKRENIEAKWTNVTQGNVAARKVFRRNLLEINAFYWLAARDKFKAKIIWIVLFVIAVIWIWVWAAVGKDFPNPATYIFTALVLHTLLKSWIAAEASARFVEDRRSGAMELLLCTSLKDQEILRGQRLALLKQFGWPVFIVLAVDLLFFGFGSTEMNGDMAEWVWCWLVGVGMFVMDLFALSWVAIWTGLTNNKTNRASGAAATRILVLPWLFFGLTLTAFGILTELPMFRFLRQANFPDWFLFVYWFAIGAVNNLLWMKWAKGNLRRNFRTAATQRFDAPRRFNWFGLRK